MQEPKTDSVYRLNKQNPKERLEGIMKMFDNPDNVFVNSENINCPVPVYFVGGRYETIKDNFIPAFNNELGINFYLIGHKDPKKKGNMPIVHSNTAMIISFKDMCGHQIRTWAKKESERLNIPFIEVVQKIKPTVEILKSYYPNIWKVSEKFKAIRSLLVPEECKSAEDFMTFEELTPMKTFQSLISQSFWEPLEKIILEKITYKCFPFITIPDGYTFIETYGPYVKKAIEELSDEDGEGHLNALFKSEEDLFKMTENSKIGEEESKNFVGDIIQASIELLELITEHLHGILIGKSHKYTKDFLNNVIRRSWLMDFIVDTSVDAEHTKTIHKVDLAFKSIFQCGIPSSIKDEIRQLLDLKHQENMTQIILEAESQPITEIPTVIVEPSIVKEEVKSTSISEVKPTPTSEEVKPTTISEEVKSTPEEQGYKVISINGMTMKLSIGSTIIFQNIEVTDFDICQTEEIQVKNVVGNRIGELKVKI